MPDPAPPRPAVILDPGAHPGHPEPLPAVGSGSIPVRPRRLSRTRADVAGAFRGAREATTSVSCRPVGREHRRLRVLTGGTERRASKTLGRGDACVARHPPANPDASPPRPSSAGLSRLHGLSAGIDPRLAAPRLATRHHPAQPRPPHPHHPRCAPGCPASTTKEATVSIAASGSVTFSMARTSVCHRSGVTSHRP